MSLFFFFCEGVYWEVFEGVCSFEGVHSRPEVFCKKGVLKNFAKSTGKHLYQSLIFNKVAWDLQLY